MYVLLYVPCVTYIQSVMLFLSGFNVPAAHMYVSHICTLYASFCVCVACVYSLFFFFCSVKGLRADINEAFLSADLRQYNKALT